MEGLRRETKGLRGSEEGGVRHDCLLDWGRPGGARRVCPGPPQRCLLGSFPPAASCHLRTLFWLRGPVAPGNWVFWQNGAAFHPRQHPGLGQRPCLKFTEAWWREGSRDC